MIGARAGLDLAVVAVVTVGVYAWFTVAAVNTRTRYIERMNVADNEATSRLLDGLLHHEVVTSNNRQVSLLLSLSLCVLHHEVVTSNNRQV